MPVEPSAPTGPPPLPGGTTWGASAGEVPGGTAADAGDCGAAGVVVVVVVIAVVAVVVEGADGSEPPHPAVNSARLTPTAAIVIRPNKSAPPGCLPLPRARDTWTLTRYRSVCYLSSVDIRRSARVLPPV